MVEEIRNKWCEDLEGLLRCSMCCDLTTLDIYDCVHGHHFCQNCKSQLIVCPMCEGTWSTSTNRIAKDMCAILAQMKSSLIDPESEVRKLLTPDLVSVACQTDVNVAAHVAEKEPPRPQGPYPCCLGSCGSTLFFEPLLKHILAKHPGGLIELRQDNNIFEHTWTFEYTEELVFDRAFRVAEMGVFFLKIASDVFGNLTACVTMIHSATVSKQFTCQLELCCCDEHMGTTYMGEICSCRTPPDGLAEKKLCASRMEMRRMTNHGKQLKCTVLIHKKKNHGEETESRNAPQHKKKNNNNNWRTPPNRVETGEGTSARMLNAPKHKKVVKPGGGSSTRNNAQNHELPAGIYNGLESFSSDSDGDDPFRYA